MRRKLCSGASILVLSSLALWGHVQPSYAQVLPVRAASGHVAPLPIPGGDLIPCPCTGQADGSLLIHQFLPGPGFDGQDAEPNGITNFNGTFAQVYLGGHTVDSAATSMPRNHEGSAVRDMARVRACRHGVVMRCVSTKLG
jgi:hypothetical protein